MLIPLEKIPPKGLIVDVDARSRWAHAGAALGLEAEVEALSGQLDLRALVDQITVHGDLDVVLLTACDRCAESIRVARSAEFDLAYVPRGSRDGESRALASDELDVGFYGADGLDLGLVVQEVFALERASRLTCDVPGATPLSGTPCSFTERAVEPDKRVDPRFAVLQGLKLDD